MKAVVAVVFGCIIFWGCSENQANKIKEKLLPSFTVNIPDINLMVPPLRRVLDKEIAIGALKSHINMDSTIKAYTAGAFGANAVHFVRVKRVVIKLKNADSANNLSNFESARMRIYSDTASTDIAVITFPTVYSDSVTITTSSPDVGNYLRGKELNYNLYWKNRKTTRKFLRLTVKVTVSVQ